MRKILVTSALPYANGPLHLGHILENIQSDIWVRMQKMLGHNCTFICGEDAHGTPIMINAKQKGIAPETLIAETKQQHIKDFNDFYIEFDNFYTTHSPENRELAALIYERLQQNGDIEIKEIEQSYDEIEKMFLPDRFVKGTCPRCGAIDQYGDNCDACGATYTPLDLLNPVSVLSNTKPTQKPSKHYFFNLAKYERMLIKWTKASLPTEMHNKLKEWFDIGLKPWDISRDAPYFGFEIPGAPNKYFYVWMDAPVGYMASFKNLCQTKPELNFDEYWNKDSQTELYHFLGKDIIYFHALFWPAMLEGASFRKPSKIFTHGFLTVNGKKMSKSRGTFINARDYLDKLDAEYLRYYLASKLTAGVEDIDLNFADFILKVNSDLVGKVVNLASRSAKFINKNYANQLAANLDSPEIFSTFSKARDTIAKSYEERNYCAAMRTIMELADHANQYFDAKKPWALAKQNPNDPEVQKIATTSLNLFLQLTLYLKPVLPKLAAKVEDFLQISLVNWNDFKSPLLSHTIREFSPLMQRIDEKTIEPWK